MGLKQEFTKGLIKENPVLRLVLGTCPTLAVTTAAINGIGMGVAATFVLLGSNIVISLLRNIIPDKVRIPAFITITRYRFSTGNLSSLNRCKLHNPRSSRGFCIKRACAPQHP